MRAFITVIGRDTVGVIARISNVCSELNINIQDVTQSILQEMFCMIMRVDGSKCNVEFTAFADEAEKLGENKALKINVMHEDIFNSMHRI